MSGPDSDPDLLWTRGVFDFDCCRNTWSRTDEQAGWHGEVWSHRDGRWRYSAHCLHTVAVPDQPDAKRFVHCHGSDGPSTATFPTKAAAMAACEQAGNIHRRIETFTTPGHGHTGGQRRSRHMTLG